MFDMFVSCGIAPTGVLITGGTAETREGPTCSVPKLTLVSRLQALLHEGRLKILRELDEAETLIRELQDFRMEFTTAGHLTFNARCGKHDDLVFPVSLPSYCGDTQYDNMHEVYDDLPTATKGRIDGLKAVHVYLSKYNPRELRAAAIA
jgi:hypothetical protein